MKSKNRNLNLQEGDLVLNDDGVIGTYKYDPKCDTHDIIDFFGNVHPHRSTDYLTHVNLNKQQHFDLKVLCSIVGNAVEEKTLKTLGHKFSYRGYFEVFSNMIKNTDKADKQSIHNIKIKSSEVATGLISGVYPYICIRSSDSYKFKHPFPIEKKAQTLVSPVKIKRGI